MAEILVVRHGQANSDATDEKSYDQLSRLGRSQAEWLGAHLAETNPHFDLVITGTLTRQADTARAMGYEITRQDPRLNELHYFPMAQAMEAQHGIPAPLDSAGHAAHLPILIDYWSQNRLADIPETFAEFSDRVNDIVDEICRTPGRTLLVTSGGVISMIMRYALGLENSGTCKVMLQTMNSSLHRLEFVRDTLMVGAFNTTPHLDGPDRSHARTYV